MPLYQEAFMAINTSHLPKLGQLQTAMTTTKTYIDGIAEAVDDALDEMDERIRGYVMMKLLRI